MPPKNESGCKACTLKDEILACLDGLNSTISAKLSGIKGEIDGLNNTMDAKLSGIDREIGSGFQGIRIDVDKIEGTQIKQWQKIANNSERIGVNAQRLSSFKWVIGILIMLQLTTLGLIIRLAMAR